VSRAYVVYILMFAVLAGGLWVILEMGTAMKAPDDVSGEWSVAWNGPPPQGSTPPVLRIDQSGRFFVVRFGNAKPISMTLQSGWRGSRDGPRLDMRLAGGGWVLHLDGEIPPRGTRTPVVNLEMTGPSRHAGRATLKGYEVPAAPAAASASRATGVAGAR
jgi:hypothetical protein